MVLTLGADGYHLAYSTQGNWIQISASAPTLGLWALMLRDDPKLGQIMRVVTGRVSGVKARPNHLLLWQASLGYNPKFEHSIIKLPAASTKISSF